MNGETVDIQIGYSIRFSPEKTFSPNDEGDLLDAFSDNITASTDFIEVGGQVFEILDGDMFDDFCVTEDSEDRNSVNYYIQIVANSDWYYSSDMNNHILPTLKDVANAIISVESSITTANGISLEVDVRLTHFTVPSHDDPEGELEIIAANE